jgi:endonuclease/exonuclease/phosphatase family protein
VTYIDLARVASLSTVFRAAADGLPRRTVGMPALGAVPAEAFGNTTGSVVCAGDWRETMTEAQTGFEHLRISVEADVGRLDSVMASFRRMDIEVADDFCAAAMRSNSLDVYNTHVASDESGPEVRDEQLGRSVDHIQGAGGPGIFAGDLNSEQPPQVDRLQAQGWTDASTDGDGNPVKTRNGQAIDKIYAGPGVVVTQPARSIDGGPSDHDGMVVDVGVAPAWP